MKQLQEFIILSAELSTLGHKENNERSFRLFNCLKDLNINFKPVEGCYKGSSEISFLVIVKDEAEIEAIKDLGLKSFEQDSILFRDFKGNTELHFGSGAVESLGKFKKVPRHEAVHEDAFTIINKEHWIVA